MSRARDTADQINRLNSSAADATAITVDSSERVMIGKTDTTFSTAGNVFYGDGSSDHTRNGLLLQLNRTTTDGEQIRLLKDGTTTGSIGVKDSTNSYIGSGASGFAFAGSGPAITPYNTTANNYTDNTIDLGNSFNRFKDAYLSGGVYLGGTTSANKLDDYETGTWTPVVASWSGTLGSVSGQAGHYIKIGKLVQLFYQFNVTNLGTASGGIFITGKPFTEDNSVISYYAGLNRPRSGTSGISELDVGGDIYLYGSSLTVSLYMGSITYKAT